jgi:hypothetical protein
MTLDVARFEFRYQLRNPVFWVALIIFFLFGFGLTASANVSLGTPGAVHENAPFAIAMALALFGIFYQFVTTSFVANAIVRDDATGFGPIVRSTPLTKTEFVLGRFIGGFGIALLGYFMVPVGMAVGVLMPWVDPETVGPNGPAPYLWHYLIIAVPNIFISCTFLLALATTFRSMLASYIGVLVFLMGYTVTLIITGDKPEWLPYVAKFELLGLAAIQEMVRYWTTAELNTRLLPFEGNLLINRLFVLGLGFVLLAGTLWRFSMAERAPSKRQLRKLAKTEARDSRDAENVPVGGGTATPSFGAATVRSKLLSRFRIEVGQVLKSPGLIVILLLAIFNAAAALWTGRIMYGTPTHPLTANVIDTLRQGFPLFLLMISIFYGGELVWRERDRKLHEIVDATPTSDWVIVLPKVAAIVVVLMLVNLAGVVTGMVSQLMQGSSDFSLGQYLAWFLAPATVDAVLIALLAVFMQVVSPNKYVGWGLMLVWFVSGIFLRNLGYVNILYTYAGTPSEPLSDMNGTGGYWVGAAWARLYWLSIGVLLMLAAHLVWPRGTVTSLTPRLRSASKRVNAAVISVGVAALAGAVGSGLVINHNIKQLNVYRTSEEVETYSAELEKKYLKYENVPQPVVTDVRIAADLHPKDHRIDVIGRYGLRNDTGAPLKEVHVRSGNFDVRFSKLEIPGARRVSNDKRFGYSIFRFDRPLAPGATAELNFASQIWHRGFRNNAPATDIVLNGTFVNNFDIAPVIGMNRIGLLSDRVERRRQGLPAELRPAKLEDMKATAFNQIRSDWVRTDITVSTDADQLPIAPGEQVSQSTTNGRRTAHFVTRAPIHNFFSIQSARYAVDKTKHGGVNLEIYYHPAHRWNVPAMRKALAAGLDYYQANFGPYQFGHARIIEFPGYASFAQAFAGTMPYSESIGFAADTSDPEKIDYVTYVTAHELGHQYWAHQAVGADMQGSTMLTETLAQYSALMVMKKMFGPDKIRRFLKYELDEYLSSRKGDAIEEVPLERVENQPYIHYRKGALVMYLLQERLGEDAVNRALSRYLAKRRFAGPPYPRSLDLIAEFRKEARTPEQQALITDLFERITLYDLKATGATTAKNADGTWTTKVAVEAAKYYADGKGVERRAPLHEAIEVGLFTERPGLGSFDRNDVISMERRPIGNGKMQIVVTSKRKPAFAGIDPYNFMIDRNSDDNVVAVTG